MMACLSQPQYLAVPSNPVAIDAFNSNLVTGATALIPVTINPVGTNGNRALVALISNDNTLTVTGVAYTAGSGGSWGSAIGTVVDGNREYEIWVSKAPTTGLVTVQATLSGNIGAFDGVMVLYSMYNVDQTTPVDGYASTIAAVANLAVVISSGGMSLVHIGCNASPGVITQGIEDAALSGNSIWRSAHNTGSGSVTTAWPTDANGRGLDGVNVRKA